MRYSNKTMRTIILMIISLVILSLFTGISSAQTVTFLGPQSCESASFTTNNLASGDQGDSIFSVNITYNQIDSIYRFAYTSNIGVDKVVVVGSNDADTYTYVLDDSPTYEGDFGTPSNGEIMEVIFCYNPNPTDPTPALGGDLALGGDPTIESDQPDYLPGAHVILTGDNWLPGDNVEILIEDEVTNTWSGTFNVVVAGDGTILLEFDLPPWYISRLEVIATGTSGVATTSFTDAPVGAYDQCSNDDGDGYSSGNLGCRWVNGAIQSNNSTYSEGDATVQRLSLDSLLTGSQHTITFSYGTTKGGSHAYDYLTNWDYSEDWITVADRCEGITGCDTWPEDDEAIPGDPVVTGHPDSVPQPAGRVITIRNATIDAVSVPALVPGDSYLGDSETEISVTFTVTSDPSNCQLVNVGGGQQATVCTIAMWFGGKSVV